MTVMTSKAAFFLSALIILLFLAGCKNQPSKNEEEKPSPELAVDLNNNASIHVEKASKIPCEEAATDHLRQGKFAYSHWEITRFENYQIEFSPRIDVEYKSTIKWLNDCEYELVCVESTRGKNDRMIGKVVHSKINYIQADTVYITATVDATKLELIMVKLE